MKRIAFLRLKRNLSQRGAANRIGVGYSSYFKIEQGVLTPSRHSITAHKLERFYGRRLAALLKEA